MAVALEDTHSCEERRGFFSLQFFSPLVPNTDLCICMQSHVVSCSCWGKTVAFVEDGFYTHPTGCAALALASGYHRVGRGLEKGNGKVSLKERRRV